MLEVIERHNIAKAPCILSGRQVDTTCLTPSRILETSGHGMGCDGYALLFCVFCGERRGTGVKTTVERLKMQEEMVMVSLSSPTVAKFKDMMVKDVKTG